MNKRYKINGKDFEIVDSWSGPAVEDPDIESKVKDLRDLYIEGDIIMTDEEREEFFTALAIDYQVPVSMLKGERITESSEEDIKEYVDLIKPKKRVVILEDDGSGMYQSLVNLCNDSSIEVIELPENVRIDTNVITSSHAPIEIIYTGHDALFEPYKFMISTKQKHPPRSFKNTGKNGKQRKW